MRKYLLSSRLVKLKFAYNQNVKLHNPLLLPFFVSFRLASHFMFIQLIFLLNSLTFVLVLFEIFVIKNKFF